MDPASSRPGPGPSPPHSPAGPRVTACDARRVNLIITYHHTPASLDTNTNAASASEDDSNMCNKDDVDISQRIVTMLPELLTHVFEGLAEQSGIGQQHSL